MIDIQSADDVEIIVDHTGKMWINVDGQCVLRVGWCKDVSISTTPKNFIGQKDKKSINEKYEH